MTEKLNDEGLIIFKEMMTANSVQLDSLAQSLIENGIYTDNEFNLKLKETQTEYEGKGKQKIE